MPVFSATAIQISGVSTPSMSRVTIDCFTGDTFSKLEWKPQRKLNRSRWVICAWVQIVAVFQPDGANHRFPPQSDADRKKAGIERVVCDAFRHAKRVREQHNRPFWGQRLLEFH